MSPDSTGTSPGSTSLPLLADQPALLWRLRGICSHQHNKKRKVGSNTTVPNKSMAIDFKVRSHRRCNCAEEQRRMLTLMCCMHHALTRKWKAFLFAYINKLCQSRCSIRSRKFRRLVLSSSQHGPLKTILYDVEVLGQGMASMVSCIEPNNALLHYSRYTKQASSKLYQT